MLGHKAKVLTLAERCKNILASNWQGNLNTVKGDATGSKQNIHTSKVKYLVKKGKPYIWVPEEDLHNVNTVIDERASFAVASPFPGPIGNVLRSMKKLPTRVALTGEVLPLRGDKVRFISDCLAETIMSEQRSFMEASYAVSGIISSSTFGTTSRSENLLDILDSDEKYVIYKLNISSCTLIDGNGGACEVEMEDLETTKADKLSPFAAKIIDGINQSEMRRRALSLFCLAYMNTNAKNAYIVSIDRKGFDVLGKIQNREGAFNWKEVRFTFEEEAIDAESFCCNLVKMEEDAVKKLRSYSGL